MEYTRQFRLRREARGMTREHVAELAGCHPNTVNNIETGRPVKPSTLVDVLRAMGYPEDSAEVREILLLWLEASSGARLTGAEADKAAARLRTRYRNSVRATREELVAEVEAAGLDRDEIRLLLFAARHPEVRAILRAVRDWQEHHLGAADGPELKAAED